MIDSTYHNRVVRRTRRGSSNVVLLLAWLVLLAFIGAGSYLAVSKFKNQQTTKAEPTTPVPTEPARPAPTEPTPSDDTAARQKAEEEAKRQAEREKLEAEKKAQEEAKRLADRKEKERLARLADEEQRKKEEQARLAAEKREAIKRNPPVVALEDVESAPDRYLGQFFVIEKASIKLANIDRHKDLGRYTIGVTSERGTYYSRVPLGGLIVSTSDKLAQTMFKQIDGTDDFFRYKLYCEIRKWGKKENARTWPDVFIYRLEAFDRLGNLTRTMGE